MKMKNGEWIYPMLKLFKYVLCFLAFLSSPVRAEDFYKNKTLTFLVGLQAGTNYDLYARLMAKHISKHIPGNPSVNVVNMVGAASKVSTNYLANVAPKDGTYIGITQVTILLEPLYRDNKLNYDVLDFNYIGGMNVDKQTCFIIQSAKVKNFNDVASKELILGSPPVGSPPYEYAVMLKNIFPNKIKIVTGYTGVQEIYPAILKGEVDGSCGISYGVAMTLWSSEFKSGNFKFLIQLDDEGVPGVDAPLITDLIKDVNTKKLVKRIIDQKEFSRTFIMANEVPKDRIEIIRKAFRDAMNDEALKQEAQMLRLELTYRDGNYLKDLLTSIYNSPKADVDQIKKLMNDQ